MVTVTCTVPADSAGDTAVKEVEDVCVTLVAAVDPNFTVAEEVKFLPVMVTEVPPAAGPEVGVQTQELRSPHQVDLSRFR